jgi:hypothetical protein
MSPVVLIAVFAVVVILIAVGAYYYRQKRIQEWQQTAAHLGFQFSTDDLFGLLDLPFNLFERGDGRGTENVAWGQKDGIEIKAFEYWYYEESHDGKGGTSRNYSRFSCTLLPMSVYCPETTIGPEGFFAKVGRALGFHDIEFESEDFNKAFAVKSSEPQFATYLCDPRMMQWLLDNKGWHFELSGPWVLTYTGRVRPMEIWNVIEAAREFHSHIPKVIEETYGGKS